MNGMTSSERSEAHSIGTYGISNHSAVLSIHEYTREGCDDARNPQEGSLRSARSSDGIIFSNEKPVEELYDTHGSFEIHNLANDPAFSHRLGKMRHALSEWQNKIGDVGLIPEAEIEILEQDAGSRFAILHSTTKNTSTEKRLAMLVDIATSASEGPTSIPKLLQALQNKDASIRYWAATGIGNIGSAATSTLTRVAESLDDPSPSVRIAAARAVGKLGSPEEALPVLEAELQSDHQWGRLAAAIVLDEMDEEARPALPSLQQALLNQPNKYIVRVANRAINELENTTNQVP